MIYKKMYSHLYNEVTKAIRELYPLCVDFRYTNIMVRLMDAQKECEKIYIESDTEALEEKEDL